MAALKTFLVPARSQDAKALMIILHGLGDSLEGFKWLPLALGLPWLNILLVNAPDRYYTGFSWYDFGGDPAPGIKRSRSLLLSLLEDQQKAGYPPGKTFLGGFSQGALMTLEVGLRYSHRLAGLIAISGYVHNPERLVQDFSDVARQQRILMTHGTLDQLIPLAPVRAQVECLKAAGLNITWRELHKGHTIAGEEELSLIRQFICQGIGKIAPGKAEV